MSRKAHLKENITFVSAHTANAAWFFPVIIVVTSDVTQKCQRRILQKERRISRLSEKLLRGFML